MNRAKMFRRLGDGAIDLTAGDNVGRQKQSFAAERFGHFGARRIRQIENHYLRAGARKLTRRCLAQSRSAAGDYRNCIPQVHLDLARDVSANILFFQCAPVKTQRRGAFAQPRL